MDALKKAEEEKKQAAKRLQEVEIEERESDNDVAAEEEQTLEEDSSVPELFTETAQFSLEPLSLEEREEETVNNVDEVIEEHDNTTSENDNPVLEETSSLSISEDLTMENTLAEDVSSQENFEQTQKEIDLSDTAILEGLSTENASAPFDDTFHGVVFEEEPDTDIYEETLPGVSADILASDLGGGKFQPTPVAAKTVFSSGKPVKKKSSFKWGIFALLILLATGSFSVFYYFTITPVSRNLPSPMVARGIESSGVENAPIIVPPVIQHDEILPPETDTIINETQDITDEKAINKELVQQAFEDEKSAKQAVIEEFEKQSIESEPEIELLDETPEMIQETTMEKALNEELTVAKHDEPRITDMPAEIEVPELKSTEPVYSMPEKKKIQADTSLLKISKSKKSDRENQTLKQAFKAYQEGHYDAARSLYESVLKNEPDNRDAHLGLGAIAIHRDDRKSAYLHYTHLLELNPHDTIAMSSLIALSHSADPVKDESAVKLLLQRDDKAPYLYFMLGNLYAKQKRWVEAQQSFFDAYRLESTNPDYVLNLAVSLDQLGQYAAALDYYKEAVELSENSSTKFDFVTVNNRVNTLSRLVK